MKCICCGGEMRYDPASFGLMCDSCGFTKQLHRPEEQAIVDEVDFESAVRDSGNEWQLIRRAVSCSQCGAVTLYDPNQISMSCPYCGSNSVLPVEDNNYGLTPMGIIPFSFSTEDVQKFFYTWNKCALWSPEDFRTGKVLGNLVGVYIPFWTFDADTVSTYFGDFGYTEETGDSSRTKWRQKSGILNKSFNDIKTCGSRRFYGDKLLNSVIQFGPEDIVPYTPDALQGFAAEKYTIGIDEAWGLAKANQRRTLESAACNNERADTYRNLQLSTEYSNVKFRYILVPVWLTAMRYKGKSYNVVCSGHKQRGNCKRPVSIPKMIILGLIVFSVPLLVMLFNLIFWIVTSRW